jgi:hypothetical protein
MARENQQHHLALLNRPRDFPRERAARPHITRRNPASDRRSFEGRANGVGYLSVPRRLGDETSCDMAKSEAVRFYLSPEEQATEYATRDQPHFVLANVFVTN